jgi:hypothetical protein
MQRFDQAQIGGVVQTHIAMHYDCRFARNGTLTRARLGMRAWKTCEKKTYLVAKGR